VVACLEFSSLRDHGGRTLIRMGRREEFLKRLFGGAVASPAVRVPDRTIEQIDALLDRIGPQSSSVIRTHAGVTFDPANGLGGSYDSGNIDYRGFMAYMRPDQFLGLNPPRPLDRMPIDFIQSAVEGGEAIGTPMLYVDRLPDNKGWQVRGHEGRGRMSVLQGLAPRGLFPVGVHPYGAVRARHLRPVDTLASIFPDEGGQFGAVRPRLSFLDQQPYMLPRASDYTPELGLHPVLQRLGDELSP
jgi:hypothetical protein